MSEETTDLYRAINEQSKAKRANNREASARLLKQYKIPYTERNFGAHLMVVLGNETIDFWPGTGLWMIRGTRQKKRGVLNLVQYAQRVIPI